MTAKIWYDDTFLDHPDVKKLGAKNYIKKVMEHAQKWMCLSSLGFQLTVDVSIKHTFLDTNNVVA